MKYWLMLGWVFVVILYSIETYVDSACTTQLVPFDLTLRVCNETSLCAVIQGALLVENISLSLNGTISQTYLLEEQRSMGWHLLYGDTLVVDKFGDILQDVSKLAIFEVRTDLGNPGGSGEYFISSTFHSGYVKQSQIVPTSSASNDGFGITAAWVENVGEELQFLVVLMSSSGIGTIYLVGMNGALQNVQTINVNKTDTFTPSVVSGSNLNMALGYPSHNASQGIVLIYTYNGVSWVYNYTLDRPPGLITVAPSFGVRLAMFDEILAVAASAEGTNATGQVYIYQLDGAETFRYRHTIDNGNATGPFFGRALSLWENFLAIGYPVVGTSGGALNIYKANASNFFILHQVIRRPSSSSDDEFGFQVNQYGLYLITSSPTEIDTAGIGYLYKQNVSTFRYEFVTRLWSTDAMEGDRLGTQVAINAHGIVLGRTRYMKTGLEVVNMYSHPLENITLTTVCTVFSPATENSKILDCVHSFSEILTPAVYQLELALTSDFSTDLDFTTTITTVTFIASDIDTPPSVVVSMIESVLAGDILILSFSLTESKDGLIRTITTFQ